MARRSSRDPITDLVTMRQAMDRLFDDAWGRRSLGWREGERVAVLPVDVYSTANELVITASVPGADPEDVDMLQLDSHKPPLILHQSFYDGELNPS